MSGATRDADVDLLRGVAIAGVVAIHTTWFCLPFVDLSGAAGRIVALLHLLSSFGVPLFIALSAFGLALRYDKPMTWRQYLDFLGVRAERLLPGYLFWSFVSLAMFRSVPLRSLGDIFWALINGTADGQFYFIPLIFAVYLAWPVLRFAAVAAAASNLLAWFVLGASVGLAMLWWNLGGMGVLPVVTMVNLPMWSIYLAMGMVAAPRLASLRSTMTRPAVAVVALAAVLAAGWHLYRHFIELVEPHYRMHAVQLASTIMQPTAALYVVAALVALFCLIVGHSSRWMALMLRAVSERSYGIFLVHLFVLRLVVQPLLPPAQLRGAGLEASMGLVILAWASTLAMSCGLVTILERWTVTRSFVSNR